MKLLFFLFTIILITSACSSQKITKSEELVTTDLACEICLLEDKIQNCKIADIAGKLKREPDEYFDSLASVKNKLETEMQTKLSFFQNELALKSASIATDSARNWCINSFEFGKNLEEERKDSLFLFLFDEMYNGASGFTLGSRKILEERKPQINDKGEIYVFVRGSNNIGQQMIIEDWETWKSEKLKSFDKWMEKIDSFLIEMNEKSYSEFSDIEKVVFRHQLTRFKYPKPK